MQRQRGLEHVDLGVAVEPQRVVLAHAALHAARGIQDQDVEAAPRVAHGLEHAGHRIRVGQVGADRDRGAARLLDAGDDLERARLLVAEVDDDLRARGGEVAGGVGADAARRAGDEGALARRAIRRGGRRCQLRGRSRFPRLPVLIPSPHGRGLPHTRGRGCSGSRSSCLHRRRGAEPRVHVPDARGRQPRRSRRRLLGAPWWVQIIVAGVLSLLLLFFVRPPLLRRHASAAAIRPAPTSTRCSASQGTVVVDLRRRHAAR